jgi:N,N'-diacetylbacillosaminyl-diphospho-undecaprenol alpha-1,3-N-acetylgalactosaminyltransferase
MAQKQRIALIGNYGMDFLISRAPYVEYLEKQGFEVYAIVPKDEYISLLLENNIRVLSYELKRNSLNLFTLTKTVLKLNRYNKEYNFSVTHSFGLQSNILNNLSFGFKKQTFVVNHITGLGFSFTRNSLKARVFRFLNLLVYQFLFLLSNVIITQNNDDRNILSKLLFVKKKFKVIYGSGVDHVKMSLKNIKIESVNRLKQELLIANDSVVITYIGRLVAEKGINEFIAMAKQLSSVRPYLKFLIIGWLDTKNPTCLSESDLEELKNYPNILLLGKRFDIKELLYLTDIYVLPTYREGFPRSILEAMAMELPVITNDVTGAKDAVKNMLNGLLLPPQDVDCLIDAVEKLIDNPILRKEYGVNGRKRIEEEFCSDIIFKSFLNSYQFNI